MQYEAKDKSRQLNRNTLVLRRLRFFYMLVVALKKEHSNSSRRLYWFFFFFPKVRNVNLQNHRELRIVTLLLRIIPNFFSPRCVGYILSINF